MGELVAFPDPRLQRHAQRLALAVQGYSSGGAERYLRAQIEKHRRSLHGAGVAPGVAEIQCAMLEDAIWHAVARTSSHGGAA